jgi:hypothetical protein
VDQIDGERDEAGVKELVLVDTDDVDLAKAEERARL